MIVSVLRTTYPTTFQPGGGEEKEREKKNTTIFAKNHGNLLATTSDYLLRNIISR